MSSHDYPDKEYVLGTHVGEVERLFQQHRAWRPFMFTAWQRAGFRPGQAILDVGCGPGAAALDLAELVGPSGKVIAIDQSQAFLETLRCNATARDLHNIHTQCIDLLEWTPPERVDGVWCRWLFSFLREPSRLVSSLNKCCLPGARIAVHEYYDYGAWCMHPRLPELDEFVDTVMASWRDMGGEPNVAFKLPRLLTDAGFRIIQQRPIAQVLTPRDHSWIWLSGFVKSGTERLCRLGYMTANRANEVERAFLAAEATPGTQMVAPSVLEIIAARNH